MIAFRYRGQEISRTLDILENQRLYCASAEAMNDWEEGAFGLNYVREDEDPKAIKERVRKYQRDLRVVCLCLSPKSRLLWAYYSSGLRGVAIEVEIPDAARFTLNPNGLKPDMSRIKVRQLDYADHRSFGTIPQDFPEAAAYEVLGRKPTIWTHEEEVRIIAHKDELEDSKFYRLATPARRVIVGARMKRDDLEAVRDACIAAKIPMAVALPWPGMLQIRHVDPATLKVLDEVDEFKDKASL